MTCFLDHLSLTENTESSVIVLFLQLIVFIPGEVLYIKEN